MLICFSAAIWMFLCISFIDLYIVQCLNYFQTRGIFVFKYKSCMSRHTYTYAFSSLIFPLVKKKALLNLYHVNETVFKMSSMLQNSVFLLSIITRCGELRLESKQRQNHTRHEGERRCSLYSLPNCYLETTLHSLLPLAFFGFGFCHIFHDISKKQQSPNSFLPSLISKHEMLISLQQGIYRTKIVILLCPFFFSLSQFLKFQSMFKSLDQEKQQQSSGIFLPWQSIWGFS